MTKSQTLKSIRKKQYIPAFLAIFKCIKKPLNQKSSIVLFQNFAFTNESHLTSIIDYQKEFRSIPISILNLFQLNSNYQYSEVISEKYVLNWSYRGIEWSTTRKLNSFFEFNMVYYIFQKSLLKEKISEKLGLEP